jgi:hypothetical protein
LYRKHNIAIVVLHRGGISILPLFFPHTTKQII